MGVRVRSTQTQNSSASAGLAAGTEAQELAEGVGAPTAKTSDSAGKRGRQMMNGVKRAHGWRVQEGKRDGG